MKKTLLLIALVGATAQAVRLKDLASVRGVKENQILGYGMVLGLAGTGDRGGEFTESSLATALKSIGVDPKSQRIGTKNTAAVVVTASIPPFSRMGAKLDVTVASIGSASSLEGGTLMLTPLKGADGKVYAVAQGRIPVIKRSDRGTATFQAALSTVIPQGALLEKDVDFDFSNLRELRYQLTDADFTTSARVAMRINEELGGKYASAVDPGTVQVILPYGLEESPVELVAKIESLDIEPDRKAKVVVNRKTGTVVLGAHVMIFPVAIAHNNLRIQVREETRVPNEAREPVAAAPSADPVELATTPTNVSTRKPRQLTFSNTTTSIGDIVTSLNEVGANPDDLVFLLQSMKSAGAMVAELELQ